jgi:hypothetical protein
MRAYYVCFGVSKTIAKIKKKIKGLKKKSAGRV